MTLQNASRFQSEPPRHGRPFAYPLTVAFVGLAILSLQWPLRVTLGSFRHDVYVDRTIVAFVATLVMVACGLPGLVGVLVKTGTWSGKTAMLAAWSLTSMLVGCLAVLLWIGTTVRLIGETLAPVQIVGASLPPLATAVVAAWLRYRLHVSQRTSIRNGGH